MFCLSASLATTTKVEVRLENKTNQIKAFQNSNKNLEGTITCFKSQKSNIEKKYKRHKILPTILNAFDIFFIIATKSASVKLSVLYGSRVLSLSTGFAPRQPLYDKIFL